jgi:hypothetical protein
MMSMQYRVAAATLFTSILLSSLSLLQHESVAETRADESKCRGSCQMLTCYQRVFSEAGLEGVL